jgi:hypothetical protein
MGGCRQSLDREQVISDPDIYRAAKMRIAQYGDDAPCGQLDGVMNCKMAAIEELQRGRRENEPLN